MGAYPGQQEIATSGQRLPLQKLAAAIQRGTTAALTAGAITVSNVTITADSVIMLTHNTQAGTPAPLSAPVAARTVGPPASGDFDIVGGGSDTSTVDWVIIG